MANRKTPPLSPLEGWLSKGRQVLHFRPLRYDCWSHTLEVTLGERIPGEAAVLLKPRNEPEPSSRDLMGQTHGQHWPYQPR